MLREIVKKGDEVLNKKCHAVTKFDDKLHTLLDDMADTLRDADGVTVRTVEEHCEILSLMGTVSEERCHLHIALSRQGLGAFGGHLKEGCLINTTCELVIGVLDGWRYGVEQDGETGYDEITFERV